MMDRKMWCYEDCYKASCRAADIKQLHTFSRASGASRALTALGDESELGRNYQELSLARSGLTAARAFAAAASYGTPR